VATKFFPYPWRIFKGNLKQALQASLKRLRLEKVDLYQIHWPFPPVPIETWASALADVVEEGLARAVGVSNYNAIQMRKAQAVVETWRILGIDQVECDQRKIERTVC
jgi:aryl-alcohol dehydrogenase-like predicted oxidoreductase